MRALPRLEYALPLACLIAAAVLAASEFMDTFQFVPALGEPLAGQTGGERHSYALLILAVFAGAATIALIAAGTASLAGAIAVAGAIALIVFLTLDLPDANGTGNLDDGIVALANVEAAPRAGFWLELVGALGLLVAGTWLALLSPEQRMAPARVLAERRRKTGTAKRRRVGPLGPWVGKVRARMRRRTGPGAPQGKPQQETPSPSGTGPPDRRTGDRRR